MVRLSMVCPYPHGLRLSVISSLMYSTRYSDFIGYEIRDKHRIKNKIVEQDFVPLKAVNAKTRFVEAGKRKIAYSSIGKGLPIIMVNRFRGTRPLADFNDHSVVKYHISRARWCRAIPNRR